jgi:hypothetical protein
MQQDHLPVIPYPGAQIAAPVQSDAPAAHVEVGRLTTNIRFNIKIEENDIRANQFACRLTLTNGNKIPVDILTINFSRGSGVTIDKSDKTSSIDLKKEYDELRHDIRRLYRSMYILYFKSFCKGHGEVGGKSIRVENQKDGFSDCFIDRGAKDLRRIEGSRR